MKNTSSAPPIAAPLPQLNQGDSDKNQSGFFNMISGFLNQLSRRNQAYTGKPGSSMYYDEKRKRYVIEGEEDDDDDEPPPPPPGVKKMIKQNENVSDSNKDAPLQQEKQKEPEVAVGLNSLTAVGFSGALASRGRARGRGGATAPVQSRFPQTFNPAQISHNSQTPNILEQEQRNTVEDMKNKDMPLQKNLEITQSHQALYTTAIDLSQSQILPPNDDLDSLKQSVLIPERQDYASLDELTIQQQIEWEKLLQECEEMWQDKFQKQNDRIKILKDRVKKYQEELTHSRQENELTIESFTQLCQDLKFRGMEEVEDLQAKIHILNSQCFLLSQDKAVLAFKNEGLLAKVGIAEEENQRLKNKLLKLWDDFAQDKNVMIDQQIKIDYEFLEPLEYGNLEQERSEEKSKLVSLVLELQIENDKLKWEFTSQRQNLISQQFNFQALNQKFEETKNQFYEVDLKNKRLEKQLIDQASGYEDKIHEIQSQTHEAAFNSRQLIDRTAKERDDLKLILMDYQREQANDKAQNAQLTQKILLVQQQLAKKLENERILMSRAYQMRPFKTNKTKQKNQQKKIGQTSDHHSDDNLSDQIDGSSENEDFDDSDTEFDNDEEFSGAEDSEGNQIEAKKITFKLGAKQTEGQESKQNLAILHSQEIIQGDDASLRARKNFAPGNTEELQGKQADQNFQASIDGITRDLKSSENAMQIEPTSIAGSSPTKQSLFDMIQKQIDNKITIEAPSEQFDDEEYSHGKDDLVGNQIRNHLRKVSQQQKQERNKRQTRKTMRQILKEQVEESRAQLKIDFEKRLQVERELHQQNHQLQLYKDGLSEIDGIIRGIMKSESITLVVKNRLTTLEEEVGDQQYKDNLSERNQIIVKNHLPEDEDEDVLGGSQSEKSKEDWDLSVETIINRIFEIQRHYQKDRTDSSHQISVLNMKLESQDSIVLDLEILQHEKTLADQELIQFKNLLGQAQLQIRQIQQKLNDVNEEASRAQIQLTTRDGEVDMLKKQVDRLGQRNEQIRDQLDSKWELRVSELREHYEREIIPSMQTQAEKRFQSQLNRIQDQNNSLQEQYLDAERKLVQLQADLRHQKETLKTKENEKTQAQEESKMRDLEKEELKNTLDTLHQTMFSDKRLQEQRLADCQQNLIQQQQFCSQLQSQISDMIEKRDQYKQQVKELNMQLSQQDLLFKQQIQQQEQANVMKYEQINQKLSQQDIYYKQQIQKYEETKNNQNQILLQTQSEILQKNQLIEQKQSECEQYQKEIKQLTIENEQKYFEKKQKEDESFWSLVRQVNQLKDENNQKSQQINDQIIIINQREQELAGQEIQVKQLLEQIQNENQLHEQDCNSWTQRLRSMSTELQRYQENNELLGQQLEAEKLALKDANSKIQQLYQNQQDQTEKSQLFDIIQQGKSEIEQLKQQILLLQEQIVQLNEDQMSMSQCKQNAEDSKDNFKTIEKITELEKLYEYQLQINDELNDKNQRLKMVVAQKDKDIEILQNNQEEAELRYIQNNNKQRQLVDEKSTKKLFDDPEEVDVFAFYNSSQEVKEQPKNIMQWEHENISNDQSTASQVASTENQEILKELQDKISLLKDEIQDKNIKINELVQQLEKQQEMGNSIIEQRQKVHKQILFQNEQKIQELEQSLKTLSLSKDELVVQLDIQKAQSQQEIEQIKVSLMESQYQLQLQQAELETKHEEEVKHIKETLGFELKKAIDLHKATNTQLLQLQENQQNSEEISTLLQIDNLQQKIKEQEDIILSLKSQPFDNNREQSYKKAAEDMANKFKEKINKEKEKSKKLQEMNSSLNQELIKMKDEHSVQSLGYSQILDNLDQTRQDQGFKDVIFQALAGLVDVKQEDSLEIMIEKLNALLQNFQEDKRQLQQLIQLNAQLSQENQDLKDQNYDLRYELQELGIKYQQSQDDLKQVLQKQAQLAERDLIKETKPKELVKEIIAKEIPIETQVKEEKNVIREAKIQKNIDMPLQIEKAKEQVQSSLFTSIASFFLTESEIQPKVEQPENEYEYYEYDDETDHAI